jgi:hypothetical protein
VQASKIEKEPTPENEDGEVKKSLAYQWEYLVKFVQIHIEIMLRRLYAKIIKEEEEISARDSHSNSAGSQKNCLERKWVKMLYSDSDGHVRIVGPLGGRPLHMCAIAVDRFGDIDFQGKGNYVTTGILEGILAFVKHLNSFVVSTFESKRPENELLTYFQKEIISQYGKDYCAAVGHYLLKTEDRRQLEGISESDVSLLGDSILEYNSRPPYWEYISTWKMVHLKKRGLLKPPERFSRILVSTGLYEGETILFPFIAGNHREAIDKLLEWQKKLFKPDDQRISGNQTDNAKKDPRYSTWRFHILRVEPVQPTFILPHTKLVRSILQLSARGLFFHPMHRRCLTSFSVWKGWMHYIKVRSRDVNQEASSKRSYFGLNSLSFAVRLVSGSVFAS